MAPSQHTSDDTAARPVLRACTWVGVLASVLTVAVHVARLGWGLDRTDEGQYLLLLADPSVSHSTVFLFGYVLHPLFALLGGDVHLLRLAGTLITVALAAVAAWLVSRSVGLDGADRRSTCIVAAGFGVGPMLWFPLTPSYNTLAFWGCCLWAAGLADAVARRGLAGPLLLGVGGVVAFSGKATTGAALAALTIVTVAVLLTVSTQARTRRAATLIGGIPIGAGAALAGLMLLVGHGPAWLIDFYREGARSVALLQGHDDLVRMDEFSLDGFLSLPATMAVLTVSIAMIAVRRTGWRAVILPALAVVLTALSVASAFATGSATPIDSPTALLAWWWLPILAGLAVFAHRLHERQAVTSLPSAERILLAATLAILPLAYVVGTNGNYWTSQARAGLFWVLAGIVALACRRAQLRVFVSGAAVFAVAGATMSLGYAYRYDPPAEALGQDTEIAQVSREGARLRLTAADAETSRHLAALAREHHLVGTPILDVTGASPGYIRQLGGRPVGSSWLLGGYPGSLDAALAAVRGDDASLVERAWVLDAPDSPRRIPGLLPALGRSLERDYEVVATFDHVLGYKVRLLRPVALDR